MYIYLIRHGQSANNALWANSVVGSSEEFERLRSHDPELTETGQQQAAAVAEYLANVRGTRGHNISRLYTSAMHRALQTTRPIAAALDLTPTIWLDIHELGGMYHDNGNGGADGHPGLPRTHIERSFPGWVMPEELTEGGWWPAERGEETRAAGVERARRVAAELRTMGETDPELSVALVSHGAFLDRLIRALLGQPLDNPETLHMIFIHGNTGISRVALMPEWDPALEYLNRVEHLPDDLVTW
jgi:2,3-bisphosphoglycerate-dependent phosphoglycerate mutase/probable phosphoglycerate mutase